jgi:hypothetical protein
MLLKGGMNYLLTVYLCFLAGGAVLPLVSFIAGSFGGGADTDIDMDVDAGIDADADIDIGSDINADSGADLGNGPGIDLHPGTDSLISIGFFPTSLMSVSSLAITFGAVGSIMTFTDKGRVITFVIAVITGYISSVVVQSIIKSLKKAQTRSSGVDENELLLYDGTVIDTVLPGQLGSVSFVTLQNVRVSYPAKCSDETLRLETGRIVKVKEIMNGVFIIEPKNKYE